MTDQLFNSSKARLLEGLLAGAVLDRMTPTSPVPRIAPPLAGVEAQVDGDLAAILRENLRAAGQHAARGHEDPSFRDCRHAACRDAANLIPYLPGVKLGATDAELHVVSKQVLAALEYGTLQAELALAA
jgi:hypothetical protein